VFVCICHAVTESDVRAAVDAGDRTAEDVAERTSASTGCGTCTERLCAVVDALRPADQPVAAGSAA
jgi:bacterioferritin-associated ferredoxin